MADIDELLRSDGQRWREALGEGNRVLSTTYSAQSGRRRALAVAATVLATVAAALVIAVVAHSGAGKPGHDHEAASPTNIAVSDVVVPTPGGSTTLTLRLQMDAPSVSRGVPLGGTLTIVNNTSSDVDLSYDCNFPIVEGQLASPTVPARPYISGGVACSARHTTIKPGSNPFQFVIPTTYLSCGVGAPVDGVTCGRGGALPDLPVGTYQTSITVNGLPSDAKTPSIEVAITP